MLFLYLTCLMSIEQTPTILGLSSQDLKILASFDDAGKLFFGSILPEEQCEAIVLAMKDVKEEEYQVIDLGDIAAHKHSIEYCDAALTGPGLVILQHGQTMKYRFHGEEKVDRVVSGPGAFPLAVFMHSFVDPGPLKSVIVVDRVTNDIDTAIDVENIVIILLDGTTVQF